MSQYGWVDQVSRVVYPRMQRAQCFLRPPVYRFIRYAEKWDPTLHIHGESLSPLESNGIFSFRK